MKQRGILFGLTALLILGGCQDKDFMNVVRERSRNPNLSCRCPDDFTMNPGADGCTRETKVDATGSGGALIEIGDVEGTYLADGSYFADATKATAWPIALEPYLAAVDANGSPLPEVATGSLPFWKNRVSSSSRVSIRSSPQVWHAKTVCVNIPEARTYSIFIGSDNNWNMKIDGQDYAACTGRYCHKNARFLSQEFLSGKHLIELKYYDEGAYGALWFEIFNQSLGSLQNASSDADLKTLFSTKNLVGERWDFDGEVCPPGYAYDVCSDDHKCSKLEKASCL